MLHFSRLATLATVAYVISGAYAISVETVHIDASNIVSDTQSFNLETVVCLQPDLTYFCRLIRLTKGDPRIATLYDPETVATVFAPTDRGINNTRWQILRYTGATLTTIATNPKLASKFIRSNLMPGSAPDYRFWRNGTVFANALIPSQTLTVIEGTGRGKPPGSRRDFFLRGPLNTARAGFQGRYNLIGGAGFVNVVEVPIIPSVLAS